MVYGEGEPVVVYGEGEPTVVFGGCWVIEEEVVTEERERERESEFRFEEGLKRDGETNLGLGEGKSRWHRGSH